MKVFISWSGQRSLAVAELLNGWIKCVLQAARPWVSSQNIERGALWFSEIQTQLQDTSIGIICLTQDNCTKPWILFEAGALAKGLSASRVCTFLIDLRPSEVENPLAQFNHTAPTKEGVWQLVRTLNQALNRENALDETVLERVFETYWPQFETGFKSALERTVPTEPAPKRESNDILSEILENTRSLAARVRDIETSKAALNTPAQMVDIELLDKMMKASSQGAFKKAMESQRLRALNDEILGTGSSVKDDK